MWKKFIVTLWMDVFAIDQRWIRNTLDPISTSCASFHETSPRFRKCNGSGFGFSTFREPATVSGWAYSRVRSLSRLLTQAWRLDITLIRIVGFHGISLVERCVTTERWWYSWLETRFCRLFWPRKTCKLGNDDIFIRFILNNNSIINFPRMDLSVKTKNSTIFARPIFTKVKNF